jgi:hypothetical protein
MRLLCVDIATMTGTMDKYDSIQFVNGIDDTVITHPVFVQSFKFTC